MIERLLFDVITGGVAFLKDNPGTITKFFTGKGIVAKDEAERIEALFTQTQTPAVVHGYARQDSTFPLYAITLGGENESQAFLGDEGGFIDDPEDEDHGADQFAAIFDFTFNLMVYAQHPDVVLYYYQLLKQIVINGFPVFKGCGLFNLRFSGADMAPDPAWVPAGLFVRRATLTCSQEYTQTMLSSRVGRAWKVQSIHIDAQGSPGEDTGDVKTQVTFPEEEG